MYEGEREGGREEGRGEGRGGIGEKKRIHMLEYITFSQGGGHKKTRTSADIYSPLVAKCREPGCGTERA